MLTKNLQVIFINYQYYNFKLFFARKWCYNKLKPFSSNFSFRRVRGWSWVEWGITLLLLPIFSIHFLAEVLWMLHRLVRVIFSFLSLSSPCSPKYNNQTVWDSGKGQRRSEKVRGHLARMSDHGNTCSYLLFSKLMYIVKLLKHLT